MISQITERRSIRKYKNQDVSREVILDILEAARLSPSGHNKQPWKFIVLTGSKKEAFLDAMARGLEREKGENKYLKDTTRGFPFATHTIRILRAAPVIIAVVLTAGKEIEAEKTIDDRFVELFDTVSIGAAVENLILEAQSQGLGTLWAGAYCYAYPEVKEFFNQNATIASIVAVGYPDENPAPRPRKSIEEIVEFWD